MRSLIGAVRVRSLIGAARMPRPHGRPWSGAFNVVMATAIVSIACRLAGLETVSVALLCLALVAFAPLAVIDVRRARHPLVMLHLAREPGRDFAVFGFVADACVVGTRLARGIPAAQLAAVILLGCGAAVWLVIVLALARVRTRVCARDACGEWLLAVVATEGLAILAGRLAEEGDGQVLRDAAFVLWAAGAVLYIVISLALAGRLRRRPLKPGDLTPDWWIVMGAVAITALAAATVQRHATGFVTAAGLVAWALATAWIPVMVAGELWQARRVGVPRFTPARWTMVFPLGMYSAAGQVLGQTAGLPWMTDIGRGWLAVALAAWAAVAAGEIHHAFGEPAAG